MTLVSMLPIFIDGYAWPPASNRVRIRSGCALAADGRMRPHQPSSACRWNAGRRDAATRAAAPISSGGAPTW